ncbi:hypothetical protein D479_02282 [Halobacillus sp. BAB-2008]|nr:hypothetical protein D479_02282 [Halobacillus sp. BAB-2008]
MVVGTIVVVFVNGKGSSPAANTESKCLASEEDIQNLQEKISTTSENGGGTVTLEPCRYVVTEPILLKSNVHLKGSGIDKTIIELKPELEDGTKNDNKIIETESGSTDITISELTVDGNKNDRKSLINDPHAHSIDIVHVDGFLIDRIKIVDSASASIMLYNSRNGVVRNSEIKDSGSNGILALQETKNVSITDNVIDHTEHQNGIFISYQQGHASSDIVIENNTVTDAADFGIEVGHIVPDGQEQHRNIQVMNNKIVRATNSGIAFRTVSDGVIQDNVIQGYGKNGTYGGDGIFVEGGFNTSGNVDVLDNEVIQTFQSGDANAIYVTGMDGTRVEGNTVEDSRGNGIFVQASVLPDQMKTTDFTEGRRVFDRIEVKNNTFKNNLKNGIHFQGDQSDGNVIEQNTVTGNGEHGIQIANLNAGNGFRIEGNDITGNKQTGISVYKQGDFQIIANAFHKEAKQEYKVSLVEVSQSLIEHNTSLQEEDIYQESAQVVTINQGS